MDRESLLISFFLKVNPTRTNSKTTGGSEAGFKLSSVYNKLDEGKKMGPVTGNWINGDIYLSDIPWVLHHTAIPHAGHTRENPA